MARSLEYRKPLEPRVTSLLLLLSSVILAASVAVMAAVWTQATSLQSQGAGSAAAGATGAAGRTQGADGEFTAPSFVVPRDTMFYVFTAGMPTNTSATSTAESSASVAPLEIASIAGTTFNIEVADTEEELRQGLAGHERLAPNAGMLFVFAEEYQPTFWMKGVDFPLDLLFLDGRRVIVDIKHDFQPQPGVPDDQLERYTAKAPAQYVLEILGGTARARGIQEGMVVDLR